MKFGLFTRLLTSLIALFLLSTGIIGYMLLLDARETVDNFKLQQAHTLAASLAEGSKDALVTKDYELLERWVLATTPVENFAYAYLSRADGVVLTHTRHEKVATKSEQLGEVGDPMTRQLDFLDRPVMEVVHSAYLGKKHMANVHLAYFLDTNSFQFGEIAPKLATILLLSLIFLSVATYLVLRRLIRPLETLTSVIENTQDYVTDIPKDILERDDEVGMLAHHFYSLMSRLSISYNKVFEEKEFSQVTLDSIGDAVIVTNENGKIRYMNNVAVQLTGWPSAEAAGHSVKDVFHIIDATTRELIPNPVEKVLQSGEVVYLSNHTTLVSRDNVEYQIADSAAPIHSRKNEIIGMVLVFNDVSEAYRLREEARLAAIKSEDERALLRSLIDSVDDLIYIKDLDGSYIAANKAYSLYVGCAEASIIGKTDNDLFGQENARDSQKSDKQVFEAGVSCHEEKQVDYDDGRKVLFDINKTLFYNSDNKVQGLIGVCRDVTDMRKQEEQLRQSMKMDALGKLTGGVAHDYNNMLGIIIGYAEMLNDNLADNPKLEKYSQAIYRAGNRGALLTAKLLAFSRVTAVTESEVNINSMILSEQDFLLKTLTSRVELVLDLSDDLCSVWLDEGELEDAVLNISINAMHAMQNNGKLFIATSNVSLDTMEAHDFNLQPGEYVKLSIKDTGVGMADDVKARIFDPFFSTKGNEGTGLGLSQVYGFVQRSKGAIKAESEPGMGTNFILLFPKLSSGIQQVPTQMPLDRNNHAANRSILVVDDEPDLSELFKSILIAEGYDVTTAGSGLEALEILKSKPIELIISDVIMPHMDGGELSEKVRELYPDIKIQLISGFNDNAQINDAELNKKILQKPIQIEVLLNRVSELLD